MRAAVALALLFGAACAPPRDPAARAGEERATYRRTQRAYDGAPPVIPHAVAALGRHDCLTCHREGMDLGSDGLAPRTPHAERGQCRQCHVEQLAPGTEFRGTTFVAWRQPAHGTRAYPGAPPTLPHPVNGRETCLGCHGLNGGSPLRTPHPDRANCLQCHVEQVAGVAPFRDTTFGGRP
jgi:cytochrome c-type protein NapB